MEIKNNRAGFTLVELSIVLVIIGLLIGGILVAQSLIDSTKVQGFVRTMQQYESSIAGFKGKYRQMPGDSTYMGGVGNNNGVLEGGYTFSSPSADSTTELGNFWRDLQRGGFLTTLPDFSINGGTGIRHNVNIPEIDIGTGAGVMPSPAADGVATENWKFRIANYNGSTTPLATVAGIAGFVAPADALAIDKKLDDSIANTGAVVTTIPACAANGSPIYIVATDTEVCQLYIDMFITADF